MDEATLIETIGAKLNARLSVPVRTDGFEDERPVPVVIVDDWTTQDIVHHNSPLAREEIGDPDGDGTTENTRWLRFYYTTRVEFLVRDSDGVAATRLKDQVKNIIRDWHTDALAFHEDIREINPRDSGSPQHTFREPRETEQNTTAIFKGHHDLVKTSEETLQDVQESVTAQ